MSVFTLKSHNFSAQLVNSLKIFSIDALQKYVIKNWQLCSLKRRLWAYFRRFYDLECSCYKAGIYMPCFTELSDQKNPAMTDSLEAWVSTSD